METQDFNMLQVGEIVAQNPKAADVFSKLNIDYCCGGKVKFVDVCAKKGLNAEAIWAEINAVSSKTTQQLDFNSFEVDFLIDYVNNVHHAYLYKNLPELDFLVNKVVTKHREKYVHLDELGQLYFELADELLGHLPKEENIIFPYAKTLLASTKSNEQPDAPFFGSVANPISIMHLEHDKAGEILHRMREITNYYTPPSDACNSHLVMLSKLQELDADLIQHIHIENNILFPKIEKIEASMSIL